MFLIFLMHLLMIHPCAISLQSAKPGPDQWSHALPQLVPHPTPLAVPKLLGSCSNNACCSSTAWLLRQKHRRRGKVRHHRSVCFYWLLCNMLIHYHSLGPIKRLDSLVIASSKIAESPSNRLNQSDCNSVNCELKIIICATN
jgi:hypothetical protein